ncbi:MAG: hypothetical protein Q4C95_09320 [Planctomycetia bacterium]|nr:hypothetical protein [Planctomycetia bacterium]
MQETFISEDPNVPDAKVDIPADPNTSDNQDNEAPEIIEPAVPVIISPEKEEQDQHSDSDNILTAGFENAQNALEDMYNDIVRGMNTRRVTSLYQQWKRYNSSILYRTASPNMSGDLNGRCRLRWYEKLYREPIASVFEVELYSRRLYCNLAGGAKEIKSGIQMARTKMDMQPSSEEDSLFPIAKNPQEAVQILQNRLIIAAELHAKSLAPLKPAEVQTLSKELYPIFCSQVFKGHTVSPNIQRAKYLIDLMQKMNRSAIYDAVENLIPLIDNLFLEQLAQIQPKMFETARLNNKDVQIIKTEAGDILVGGKEDNVWNLDNLSNVCCIIDLGGNDTYNEGSCNLNRPLLVVLDLGEGNDKYIGSSPGIQGGSILGVSLWYNHGGDNSYNAKYLSQGSSIGGAGILIDNAGNDTYRGFVRAQGSALCGLGLLIDREGKDDYRSALFAQGLGHPGGFGALIDKSGNDHYYLGGYYQDSYPQHPGYDGWGQGLGTGIRPVACGGIGTLLDGDGDDVYEFDYFAHGGGYWMGIGFARDFNGNDKRLGATLNGFDGRPRHEARWQRFSNGFGCHYAVGYLFDDYGSDSYNGTIMGLGMGWDLGAGFLVDFDGSDIYEANGGLTQGSGGEGSIGVLLDYRGKDIYRGNSQGYSTPRLTYHMPNDCGCNFSFLIDHGGNDQYGSGVRNNSMAQRGTSGGFVIDRPTDEELSQIEQESSKTANKSSGTVNVNRPKTSSTFELKDEAARTPVQTPYYSPQHGNNNQKQPRFNNPLRRLLNM